MGTTGAIASDQVSWIESRKNAGSSFDHSAGGEARCGRCRDSIVTKGGDVVFEHPDTDGRVGARREGRPARHRLGPGDRRQSHRADCLAAFHVFTTDTQMLEDTPAQYKARMQHHAETTLGAVAHTAQAVGVACETVHVAHEHPYHAIIDTAESKGCDLIVMASHGRHGISAIILGSETVKVLTHSRMPVLVHR
jgi:nucleotide-binding universal stress UspA family protein